VEVLSAGQDFKKDAEGKPVLVQVVNLLVTPEQAEQLSLASQQTSIQLVLRNPLDRDVAKTPGTALSHLFLGGKFALPKAPGASEVTQAPVRRTQHAAAPAPPPVMQQLPPPPKKEAPFVMEIISGSSKVEKKFESADKGDK
jgi:pilus assembly protein CpaB